MLHDLLIVSGSGLVLFSKSFDSVVKQPRLTGSLVTAILEFCAATTGVPVSYIQLTSREYGVYSVSSR